MATPQTPPPLNEDQQKVVAAAEKILVILDNPETEKAAKNVGLGAFFAKGTANYSTADYVKSVGKAAAVCLPRLLVTGGTDLSAWIQLGVGIWAASQQGIKALSKLAKDDAVYEELYTKYPIFTFTCNNGNLDFQNPVFNICSNARHKAIDVLEAQKLDPLFYSKLCTWLYWGFGIRKDGEFWGNPNIYYPNVQTGKVERRTFSNIQPSQKSLQNADFLQDKGYNGQFDLPFYLANGIFNIDWFMESAQQFLYTYTNNLLDDNFNYCALLFNNAGFPNPDTVRDETRANNYFFESFRTAAQKLELEKKKKEEQTTMYYYIVAGILILLLIYYFYTKK